MNTHLFTFRRRGEEVEGVNREVNKACEPIALLLVLLLLLLLHSSSEFVQSAAALSNPRISAHPLSMEQSVRFLLSNKKTKRRPLRLDLFPIMEAIGGFLRVLM